MKGLWIHDLIFFRRQTALWVILLALTLLYTFMEMPYFMIGFGTIYLAMFAIKTIHMEISKANGAFFFTLPFSNRQFVFEKYLLVIGLPFVFSLVLSALSVIVGQLSFKESLFTLALAICSVMVMSIVMIPLTIRFQDKSIFISMALMAGLFLAFNFFQDQILLMDWSFLKEYIFWFELGVPLLLALLLAGSIELSLKWLKAKQF